ncbi:MAG: DUF3072 domain-containing protein [Aurantimonas endophytica]|uniref:DUF3072 domain-containing protein n=1 Tax=Aurantimonas endophytica TaxID=1522175 RepID=A0A7W6HF53_9HYPH|nr:DUF3072 domain-containing protein [Aurantimonas endophytica]MBB4003793.1 hypothetical protein [Aurantimonas endophytica]MCO6404647.1 DUF3072 domain-containing protein [Aurantimonas endophytica]
MATPDPKNDNTSNTEKDPAEWTTGGEPMTGAQGSYLKTLCEETGHEFDAGLSKADASILIDKLRGESDRVKAEG